MAAKPCVNTTRQGVPCGGSKNHPVHSRWHEDFHPYWDKTPAGIQPMSSGMRAFRKESGYDAAVAEARGTPCQAAIAPNCTGYAEHLHEDKTRGRFGGLKGAVRSGTRFIPACDPCNQYISEHPVEAREKGLVVSNKGKS